MLCSICNPGSPNLLHYQQHAPEAILLKQLAAHEPSLGVSGITAACCVTTWWSSCIYDAEGMTTHKPLPALYSFSYQSEKAQMFMFDQATCSLWKVVRSVL